MPRNLLIQVRRDTSANWTSANPVLESGEAGLETNSGKVKVGDGSTQWNSLRYLSDILNENNIINRMLRDSVGTSVIGRPSNSVGNPSDIQATFDGGSLKRTGSILEFSQLPTESFADGSITSSKFFDGTIRDIHISPSADLSPSKLGPGILSPTITASTPNYVERSITVDKLNADPNPEGIGVWLDYPAFCYRVFPKGFFGGININIGGLNPITGEFGYWPAQYGGLLGFPIKQRNRSPKRTYFTLETEMEPYPGIKVVYARYAVINNTCFVNVLIQFVQKRKFRSVLTFTLPFPPAAPDRTTIGTGYHLSSRHARKMPAIKPIIWEDDMVAFLSHRSRRDPYWRWDEANKALYYGQYRSPDRLSFSLMYEIKTT